MVKSREDAVEKMQQDTLVEVINVVD